MSFQQGTRWVPEANGGMRLMSADGTTLTRVTADGVQVLASFTTAERDALDDVEGLFIYNSSTNKLNFNTGAAWEAVTSA